MYLIVYLSAANKKATLSKRTEGKALTPKLVGVVDGSVVALVVEVTEAD